MTRKDVLLSVLVALALAGMSQLIEASGYNKGYLAGLNKGWADCQHPMRDIRDGETRCPGSDLPRGVALNLQ